MRNPLRKNLSVKLAFTVMAIALLLGAAFNCFQVIVDFSHQRQKAEAAIQRILVVTSHAAVQAVLQLDDALAEQVVTGLMKYPFIVKAVIRDENDIILASKSESPPDSAISRMFGSVLPRKKSFSIPLTPASEPDRILGALQIRVDWCLILEDFFNRSTASILFGLFQNLIIGALFFIAVLIQVAKPLANISDAFSRIDPDRPQATLLPSFSSHREDELGKLIDALNAFLRSSAIHLEERQHVTAEFDYLIDTANAPIIGVDLRGRINEWNRSAERVTGFKKNEMTADQMTADQLLADFVADDYREKIGDIVTKAFGGQARTNIKLKLNTKDGSQRLLLFNAAPRRSKDGQITGVIGIGQDITEIDKFQKELAHERNKLEVTVEARTRELKETLTGLEQTNLQLQEINRHKNQFLSTMSHELRTPLNGIIGSADLLHEQLFGPLNPKQLGYTKQINDSAEHLLALINDLLDMAKIDAGAMTAEAEYIALTDWIDTTMAIMKAQFRKKLLTTETIKDPSITHIYADRRKCKQIMLNLLFNAIKFTPQGGEIKVRTSKKNDRFLLIEISDTGCGVKEDERDKIFSEFYQTDQTRNDQIGGTGIGLALTRRMVEMHEGQIGVKSQPVGPGSVFWFTLPLKQAPAAEANEEEESANVKADSAKLTGRRILVVEDNEINLSMVLDMLSIHEYKIAIAKNGQLAIDLAQTFKPELILMDVQMPVMDGLEATRILRAMPAFAETPIIALTASVEKDAQNAQVKAGCTAHLSKPIRTGELLDIIERYLG